MKIKKTETFVEHDIIMNGTKVGTVELCPERHEISRLVIFEPYQNKGYGTQTVKDLVAQGYKLLWVRSDNRRAIHVYEKCGFVRGETHMFEMVAESDGLEEPIEKRFGIGVDKIMESAQSCEGCKHLRKWENEVEYGYPSPCTVCKRKARDYYER